MIVKPMDVLTNYQIRKTKKQKAAFSTAVSAYAASLRYPCTVEKGCLGSRNIILGDPAQAKYLITAHYDTCPVLPFPNFITPCNLLIYLIYQFAIVAAIFAIAGLIAFGTQYLTNDFYTAFLVWYAVIVAMLVLMLAGPANRHTANDNTSGVVTLLEIMRSMPENQKDKVCFVLFDLEEAGLIGSASYRSRHRKETQHQIILNLDCIGDGDEIVMFPSGKLRRNGAAIAALDAISQQCGKKKLYLHKKGYAYCPSDQANFPLSVGIMAFHRKKVLGLYCSRIHTPRDTVLEQTNVNILRAAIISLICQ